VTDSREIGVSLLPPAKVEKLQAALHTKAKNSPDYRFYALYDKVYRWDMEPVATAGRCNQGICRSKGWLSEFTFVRDNAERGVCGSIFGPVGAKVDFQIHKLSRG
jgi:hypothetical protein